MAYFQPRIPYRFTQSDGTEPYDFPLAEYEFEWEQGLRTAFAPVVGGHGAVDLLGRGIAPKDNARLRISCTAYEDTPEEVDDQIEDMQDAIFRYGRGRLYTKGSDGMGGETLLWARARPLAMPRISWRAGDVLRKQASLSFEVEPFWRGTAAFADSAATATGTLTIAAQPTAGDTLTIGGTTYTFVADMDFDTAGEISIGANVGEARTNIVAAINGTDCVNDASEYATAGAFSGSASTITAAYAGQWGNAVAFAETFTNCTNTVSGSGFLAGGSGSPYPGLGSFTINNPGTAAVFDGVYMLDGSYTNPVIRNTTNGMQLQTTGSGTRVRYNAGTGAVEEWSGSAWVNDYANFVRQTQQAGLMVLEPGDNVFTITGTTAATRFSVTAYPAYH